MTTERTPVQLSCRCIGLDVHVASVYVTELYPDMTVRQYEFPNDEKGLQLFRQTLQATDRIAMEATPASWHLHRVLSPRVAQAAVANPTKLAGLRGNKPKSDRHDSHQLAILLAFNSLPEIWMPDAETQAARELVSHRMRLSKEHTRITNRIRALLVKHGLTMPTSDLRTQDARDYLQTVMARLPEGSQKILESLLRHKAFLESEQEKADAQVETFVDRKPEAKLLQSLPLGPVLILTILAVIGSIGRFPSQAALVNYTGLIPRHKSSAGKIWQGGITKAGPQALRWALLQAAQQAIKQAGRFQDLYRRVLRNSKNNKGVAKVAVARELAEVIWQILTSGAPYPVLNEERARRKEQRRLARLNRARETSAADGPTGRVLQSEIATVIGLAGRRDSAVPVPPELKPKRQAA